MSLLAGSTIELKLNNGKSHTVVRQAKKDGSVPYGQAEELYWFGQSRGTSIVQPPPKKDDKKADKPKKKSKAKRGRMIDKMPDVK